MTAEPDDGGRAISLEASPIRVRAFEGRDAEAVDSVALEAFEQYREVYDDWATLQRAVRNTSGLAREAELLVAEVDGRSPAPLLIARPFRGRGPIFSTRAGR